MVKIIVMYFQTLSHVLCDKDLRTNEANIFFFGYEKDDKPNLQTSFKIFYHVCVFFQRCELLYQLVPHHRNLQLCNKCCQGSECNKKLCIGESALKGFYQNYRRSFFKISIKILETCHCYNCIIYHQSMNYCVQHNLCKYRSYSKEQSRSHE